MNPALWEQYLRKIGPSGNEGIVVRHDIIKVLPYRLIVL